MPISLPNLPKPLGLYMEVSFLDGDGQENVILVNYRAVGNLSELSFDTETLMTDEPLDPMEPPSLIITSRSLEQYNVKVEARHVEVGEPYSRAKQAVLALLAEAEADAQLARSPRKLLDRLKDV